MMPWSQLQSALGVLVLLLVAWLLSEDRRLFAWRFVLGGLLVQFVLAAILLKLPLVSLAFEQLNRAVFALLDATTAGSSFVFGFLGGGPLPYEETNAGASIVFAFRFMPLVLVLSAITALLTYWRVLPGIVRAFAWVFERALGVGGAVAVSSAANIFLGMVEAPVLVRPYVARLTHSELFTIMCTGLAGIAGTVFVLYATLLADVLPNAAGHLLVASVITVPASIVLARIMVPELSAPTPGSLEVDREVQGPVEAIMYGTRQGLEILLNVLATLLVFVALVYLANLVLALLPLIDGSPLTLQRVAGWIFAPVAWLFGVPWQEAHTVGSLLGTKTVLNELIAYRELGVLPAEALGERSRLLTTYALCGFANFGSVGILVAGLTTIAPARRAEITRLGLRSLIGGTLATCMTAAVVGVLV
jgi:CNT family concentrative nucleoside transporter